MKTLYLSDLDGTLLRSDAQMIGGTDIPVVMVTSALAVAVGVGIILFHIYKARTAGKKPFIFVDRDLLATNGADYLWYEKSMLSRYPFGLPKAGGAAKAKDVEEVADEDYKDGFDPDADLRDGYVESEGEPDIPEADPKDQE